MVKITTRQVISCLVFVIPILLILFVVAVNRFPEGYTFGGGDTNQLLNVKESLKDFYYIWNDRLASPGEGGFFSWFNSLPYYYFLYYLPAQFGLSNTQILSFVLFWFLTLSYGSFWACLNLVFGSKLNPGLRSAFSLLYAVNFTTLYFFTYTWGFSHQVLLYLFLPILTGIFIKFLEEKSSLRLYQLSFFLILTSVSFVNAAFLFSLIIYFVFFFSLLIILRFTTLDGRLAKLGLYALFLVSLGWSYWLLPTLVFAAEKFEALVSHQIFDLRSWLSLQAVGVLNIYNNVSSYLPLKDYWGLPFLPLGLLITLLIWHKKPLLRERKILVSLLAMLVLFIYFLKKTSPPFSWITLKIMSVPFLAPLRSYEKVAIFLPLLIIISLSILIPVTVWKRSKPLTALLIFLMILSPLPFWTGGILTKYSASFGGGPGDYKQAYFSFLEKVPDDYYQMSRFVNLEQTNNKIQAAPFAVINSITWVNYPKWQHTGIDPTTSLFAKNIVSQISAFYPLNENWLKDDWAPEGYLTFLSHLSVDSILFHKDARIDFVNQALPKLEILEKAGKLKRVKETENLILDKFDESYQLPVIYTPNRTYIADMNLVDLSRFFTFSDYKTGAAFFLKKDLKTSQEEVLKANHILPNFWQKIENDKNKCATCFSLPKNISPGSEVFVSDTPQNSEVKLDGKSVLSPLADSGQDALHFSLNNLAPGPDHYLEVETTDETNLLKRNKLEPFDVSILKNQSFNINPNKFDTMVISLLPFRDNNLYSVDFKEWDVQKTYNFSLDYSADYPKVLLLLLEKQRLIPATRAAALEAQTVEKSTVTYVDDLDSTTLAVTSSSAPALRHYEASFQPTANAKSAKMLVYFYEGEATASAQDQMKFQLNKIWTPKVYLKAAPPNQVSALESSRLKILKINPTQYRVKVANPSGANFLLVLNESFHPGWKVYRSQDGSLWNGLGPKKTYQNGLYEDFGNLDKIHLSFPQTLISTPVVPESDHFMVNGFANSWLITPEVIGPEKEYDLVMEFVPQEYFYWSVFLSLGTLLFCGINLIRCLKK